MEGAGAPLGPAEPVRTEIVHASGRTRVTRMFFAGGTVIRKEPLGPHAERRLARETATLVRLHGVAGVAQLAEGPRYPGSVVLVDAGETSLAGLTGPAAVDDLVRLALRLADAVAGMHRREVIHRDITPANIVLSADGAPCLVDFALATSLAGTRLQVTPPGEIVGTLAYLAPEQTGRTDRPVDERADLYALGATLYELATGEPPFSTGPAPRLLHDHLARMPVPPAAVVPGVPEPLSEIIMHLLEKEPDNRYQSADGLVHDLERLRDARADPRVAVPRAGEHDVPARLLPPSRLAGRDAEIAELHGAFTESLAGQCAGVLISGAPGVGKTALAEEPRPIVVSSGGWFVTGKFDQYRRDLEFDATHQAFRALGRLLLAEPDDELAEVRERILAAVGPNAGLLTAVIPEFAALLAVPPDPGDPLTAQARAQLASARALRAIASKERPVLMFLDDLQWAGTMPLGLVDLMLSEMPAEGLLLVCAYRDGDVVAGHPLGGPLSRWRGRPTVRHLRLANLGRPGLITMVAEMLHAGRAEAAVLADAIEPRTRGNPYETVELLNALRRDGVLTPAPAGWRWQAEAVRARLDRSEDASRPGARLRAMPEQTGAAVEAMGCLGGRAQLRLLRTATGTTAGEMAEALEPAIQDGLLILEPGAIRAVRFRHDRLREAVLGGIEPERRRALQLAMARRLAAAPELFAVAAEQYLPVADMVADTAERRVVAALLARGAERAAMVGDSLLGERLLTTALALTDPGETATVLDLRTRRHAALFNLGRLNEADQDYAVIDALTGTVLDRPEATPLQMYSLIYRGRSPEATELGVTSLRQCGIAVPAAEGLPTEVGHQLDHMYWWLGNTDADDDAAAPEVTDPALVVAGGLLSALLPAAFFVGDLVAHGWAAQMALRIWTEHGASRALVGPAANAAFSAVALRGDYAAAYRVARRVLALGEARGYEPHVSQARLTVAFLQPWFAPVETSVQTMREAREGLIVGGELAIASYTYHQTVAGLLDCGPTIAACLTQVDTALSFARRTGNEEPSRWLHCYRWLADVLRRDAAADEAALDDTYENNPSTLAHDYLTHAIVAAIFGDRANLARYSAAALPLMPTAVGLGMSAAAYPLRGLSLTWQARAAGGAERAAFLAELDDITRWLAARAADAPDNFLHLLRLVEAERAWTEGDFRAAALAFDAARREAAGRQRPWHRALITERAARFQLARGLEQAGYEVLARARQEYLAWGATAKVRQLDWAYPALRLDDIRPGGEQPANPPSDRAPGIAGAIDLLGILSASQALSSETSVERLHARVTEVLAAMTGATGVCLVLWDEERQDWRRAQGSDAVRPGDDGERAIPMSVLRFLRRTREPLTVADATADDRFARDPYFTGVGRCSLLAVPILSRGLLRAVLLLENRLIRGAFTAGRLDAVQLIAGQLAVSLDNAQLYADFRRIADEQATLRRVATLVARGAPPDQVFAAVAEEVGRLVTAKFAVLIRYEGQKVEVVGQWATATTGRPAPTSVGTWLPLGGRNVSTLVHQTGEPARIDYAAGSGVISQVAGQAWGFRSSVGVPVSVEGRLWGVMIVAFADEELPASDIEARLAGFTELVATAIANAEGQAEVMASRARIVAAADQARRRIERDLHDGAQQRLVTLALQLRGAREAVPPDLADLGGQLDRAVAGVASALDELREIARGIHPAILADGGLRPALRTLGRRSPIPVRVDVRLERRLPEQVEVSAYYVVAEALTNAARHARASAASVEADVAGDVLRIAIHDDGAGGASYTGGSGLAGVKDRVEALGGRIFLDSPAGAGTSLRVELPITSASTGATSR